MGLFDTETGTELDGPTLDNMPMPEGGGYGGDWWQNVAPSLDPNWVPAGYEAPSGDGGNFLTNAFNKLFNTKASGAELGLGGVGLMSLLAALNQKAPVTATNEASQGSSNASQLGMQEQAQTGTQLQESLGNSTQAQSGTATQVSESVLPDWYLDMLKGQAGKIEDIGDYKTFGKNLPDMPIEQYMNPYLEQAMNPVMRRMEEDQAKERQKFDAERVSRGGFGSARADLMGQQQRERQGLERQNLMTSAYNQAYNTGSGQAMTDLNRQFEDWKLQQADPRALAGSQADILRTLNPGAAVRTTGTTTGVTAGQTAGTTAGATTGNTLGSTLGTSVGQTAATGQSAKLGAAPNTLGQIAGIMGTGWSMANPQGLPK